MSKQRFIIFSPYGGNVSSAVASCQKQVIEQYLPQDWVFEQQLVRGSFSHPIALDEFVRSCNDEDFLFLLDIDCIPLSEKALPFLARYVAGDNGRGLVGAIQRANHIQNGKHLYVGPFCMAFSKAYYKTVGSPSFVETYRGDAGEELTYRWVEASGFTPRSGGEYYRYPRNVHFIWPSSCLQPMWDLDYGFKFGFGTTYGTSAESQLFFHQFNIRVPEMQQIFVKKCEEILNHERTLV